MHSTRTFVIRVIENRVSLNDDTIEFSVDFHKQASCVSAAPSNIAKLCISCHNGNNNQVMWALFAKDPRPEGE